MKISRRSLFSGRLVARHCLDGRNDGYGGYNDKFFMFGRNGQAAYACEQENATQIERSFARSNIQAIILHLVRDGVAGRH